VKRVVSSELPVTAGLRISAMQISVNCYSIGTSNEETGAKGMKIAH
jgi:hypothetical protein